MSCEAPGLEQYYSPHPDQYPDLINIQYQSHNPGHNGIGNGHQLQYSPSGAVQYSPHQQDMSPPPPPLEWDSQDHYSGGSAEVGGVYCWDDFLFDVLDHPDAPLAIQSNLQHFQLRNESTGTGNRSTDNFTATEAGHGHQASSARNTAQANHQEFFLQWSSRE